MTLPGSFRVQACLPSVMDARFTLTSGTANERRNRGLAMNYGFVGILVIATGIGAGDSGQSADGGRRDSGKRESGWHSKVHILS